MHAASHAAPLRTGRGICLVESRPRPPPCEVANPVRLDVLINYLYGANNHG